MTDLTPLSLRRAIAALQARLRVARSRGTPTADLEANLEMALTRLELTERLALQADAGYRPVALV